MARLSLYGGVNEIGGTKILLEDGEYCVDIETSGINQRGENTIPGYSIVALPSKEKGIYPLQTRLPPKEFRGTGT